MYQSRKMRNSEGLQEEVLINLLYQWNRFHSEQPEKSIVTLGIPIGWDLVIGTRRNEGGIVQISYCR
ncbi:predicted protein [Botrytis cinerea T4]|uniref:Uncharacterized protein n=1 Tax=Botryotinia fuckeliana (strain T4) TaxID=999810 RepID=G2YA78_BOTF4|nr:predicted protein [Botrytis cinerea T4]